MSKRPIHQYKEEQLIEAMAAIRNGMKIREASRVFKVPRGTLQDRVHLRVPDLPRKMGPETVLTKTEETALKNWCIALAKCGFPLKRDDLLNTVHNIISEDKRPNPFVNNRPGNKWYQSFLRQNPELSERTPENISNGRAAVTEAGIRKWFAELMKHLEDINASDILIDPDRIFNGDETSFYICPKTGKVIAPRDYKNVYKIVKSKEKEAVTVLIFISASGKILPPCVVFPYVRPPKEVVNSMPDRWLLGKSKTGWMKSEIFFDYFEKGLNEWLKEEKIKKPVLVFVDGHKSHLTMRLSEYCHENCIILYALPPNATHLIQPADVSVFKPLKVEWKNTVYEWATQPENVNSVLTKATFSPLLKKILEKENLSVTISNGFRKCGLYPFNPNALDYSKCVQNNLEKLHNATKNLNSPGNKIKNRHLNTAIKCINQLSNELENAGVDTTTVIKVLSAAKNMAGPESLNSTKNSTDDSKMDNSSACDIDKNQSKLASESNEILDISLPIIGDYTLINNLSTFTEAETSFKKFEIIADFEATYQNSESLETHKSVHTPVFIANNQNGDCVKECVTNHTPVSEEFMENKVPEVEINTNQDIIDKENEDVGQEINTYYNMENTRDASLPENNNYIMDNLKDIRTDCKLDQIKNNIEQEEPKNVQSVLHDSTKNIKSNINILSNVIVKSRDMSPILNKYLTLPAVATPKRKIKSTNRIGAISSDEWRQFE
ncbi:unnamed protein product [Danaus chrysippus]|uniref:(African queen) hypothetical protein n=1 Tax=Danaus chrysippus TaxID=151541 RepID=A0A8J2W3L2_9NEOP|nr:unnamed protein product [Danaus chrysippus]